MQNELAMLQSKIQGLEAKLTFNPKESSMFLQSHTEESNNEKYNLQESWNHPGSRAMEKHAYRNKNSDECFTFHNTEIKDSLQLNTMERNELDHLKRKTSPLRIKKKMNAEEGCISVNDSMYAKDKDFNSIRNSYNYIIQNPQDRENISLHSNMNYSMTQKYNNEPNKINIESVNYDSHGNHTNTTKNIDYSKIHPTSAGLEK